MHPPQFTIGRLLLVVAAFCIGLASLEGHNVWFIGLSMLSIIGLLGAAIGAESGARSGPSSPRF
jgi:hypothetical protein